MGWAVNDLFAESRLRGRPRPIIAYLSQNHEETVRFRMAKNYRGSFVKRAALHYDAMKAAQLERFLLSKVDLVTVVTVEDQMLYERTHPTKRYLVLAPCYSGDVLPERLITEQSARRAVILGSFDWLAKQIDLQEFLGVADPMFAAAGAEIQVVGRGPDHFLSDLRGRLHATKLVGAVDSVTPYLQGARIGIVHERTGGGFKLKVLDYVFNRVPIAALDGSVNGVSLKGGHSILLYPNMEALSRGILAVMDDVERLNVLQRQALQECLDSLDWDSRGRALFQELHRLRCLTPQT